MVARTMTRDRKLLIEQKRSREPDPTFYADDAELQEADQDTLREFGHDAMAREDEYEDQ